MRVADLLDPDAVVKNFRLDSAQIAALPPIDFLSSDSSQTYDDSSPGADVVLAPLPFDEIRASWTDLEGGEHAKEIRAVPGK